MRGYDAWLTTDRSLDYEPPPPPKCGRCGSFLRLKPDSVEDKDDAIECDGTVTLHPQEYDEGLIAILGEEYSGKTYDVAVSACGIDTTPHDPHREVQWAWGELHRTCPRCGHDDVTVD